MSNADRMFKKLGYEKYENHPISEKQNGGFTTQDAPYICYRAKSDTAIEEIRFTLWNKNIWFSGYIKDIGLSTPCPINMKELEAISMKTIELGWRNNE